MSFANPTDIQMTKYAESYIVYGVKLKAIKNAFPDSKATDKTLTEKASVFHDLGNVQTIIENLHKAMNDAATKDALYTAEMALEELEQARVIAMTPDDNGKAQPAAMVSASMGKSKIAGLLIDKIESKDITQPVLNVISNGHKAD